MAIEHEYDQTNILRDGMTIKDADRILNKNKHNKKSYNENSDENSDENSSETSY